ncbi:helix-turn-helix domain-containing protein [Xenorhabdus griffiniae]|uniref:helix-turn-helix domain-containing protein n=1 Tax=Xenorhabdus griffiniae TaxID=351672 RepID=UPI0023599EDD|nr:hypothetical protein [Xenorhabdus griffiniae]MDC9605148.1 hypothetical protein [Xenorhabdus griffiniae]
MENNLFNNLLSSVEEMVAIENGDFGMKQSEFAEMIGASVSLVRSWEQKRRIPSGTARFYPITYILQFITLNSDD